MSQEGASNISVFGRHTRTTCAIEAYNGVIGRKIRGNTNIFRFIDALLQEEFARSVEFGTHLRSGGDIRSNKRAIYRVSKKQINFPKYIASTHYIFQLVILMTIFFQSGPSCRNNGRFEEIKR